MQNEIAAYIAGALDSDGHITIKKSTYGKRKNHGHWNPTYIEKIGIKHVTPQVPALIWEVMGNSGALYNEKPGTKNSKPLFVYECSNKIAVSLCLTILPHLRIKTTQAKLLLELRHTKDSKYTRWSYWFNRRFPNWANTEPLISETEAAKIMRYKNTQSIKQALKNNTLLAIPNSENDKEYPRIPRRLVNRIAKEKLKHNTKQGGAPRPPQLIAWRERIWEQIRQCNKLGINGTPTFHKTGYFTMKE